MQNKKSEGNFYGFNMELNNFPESLQLLNCCEYGLGDIMKTAEA